MKRNYLGAFAKLVFCAAPLILVPSAGSSVRAEGSENISLDPDVKIGVLDNGFTYYILRNPQVLGSVEMKLVVRAGFPNEDPDQLGVAHLIEHLAFSGSARYPGTGVRTELGKLGLTSGNGIYGVTGDVTTYAVSQLDSTPTSRDKIYDIFREWASAIEITPPKVEIERGVVLAELTQNAGSKEFRLLREAKHRMLDGSSYDLDYGARHKASVEHVSTARILDFFKQWYRPDLQAFIVVGDVDVDQEEKRIRSAFANLPKPSVPIPTVPEEAKSVIPLSGMKGFVGLVDEGLSNSIVEMSFKKAETSTVLNFEQDNRGRILTSLASLMLEQRTKDFEDRNPTGCSRINMQFEQFWPNKKIDSLSIKLEAIEPQEIELCSANILRILKQVEVSGFTRIEFDRGIAVLRESLGEQDRLPSSLDLVSMYAAHFAQGAPTSSRSIKGALQARLLSSITLDEMNRFAAGWINMRENFGAIVLTPRPVSGMLQTEESFRAKVAAIEAEPVRPYSSPIEPPAYLMSEQAVSAIPVARLTASTKLEDFDATEVSLSNGIKIIFAPGKGKVSDENRIRIQGFRLGGLSGYHTGSEFAAAQAIRQLNSYSGAGDYDWLTIRDFMSAHEIGESLAIDGRAVTIGATSSLGDLEKMLQLIFLRSTAPNLTSEGFDRWLSDRQKASRRSSRGPNGHDVEKLIRDDRFIRDTKLDIDGGRPDTVSFAKVRSIYDDRFGNAGDYKFVVTGNYDEATIAPIVMKYLGGLGRGKSTKSHRSASYETLKMGQTAQHFGPPAQEPNALVRVRFFANGEFADNLVNRMTLELLAKALRERMANRLRGIEAATYHPTTQVQIFRDSRDSSDGSKRGAFSFAVSFLCSNAVVDRMVSATREEFERFGNSDLSDDEFEAVESEAVSELQEQLRNGLIYSSLIDSLMRQEDPGEVLKKETILSQVVDKKSLAEAAQAYLGDDKNQRIYVENLRN